MKAGFTDYGSLGNLNAPAEVDELDLHRYAGDVIAAMLADGVMASITGDHLIISIGSDDSGYELDIEISTDELLVLALNRKERLYKQFPRDKG